MNNYIVVISQNNGQAIASFGYPTIEGAKEKYYTELAYACNQKLPLKIAVLDITGDKIIIILRETHSPEVSEE